MSLHSIRDPGEPESMNREFFCEIETLDNEIYKDVDDKRESYVCESEDGMFIFDIEDDIEYESIFDSDDHFPLEDSKHIKNVLGFIAAAESSEWNDVKIVCDDSKAIYFPLSFLRLMWPTIFSIVNGSHESVVVIAPFPSKVIELARRLLFQGNYMNFVLVLSDSARHTRFFFYKKV